jgi:AraC-like DNA-binding protein
MATLFDTTTLAAADRNDALEDVFDQAGLPIHVTHCRPTGKVRTRLHYWKFGTHDLFLAQGPGLRLTRAQAQLRIAAPEVIRLGFQVNGSYTLSADGHDEANSAGHLNFIDQALPCEFTQYGDRASTASLEISYDELGFPVDQVRKAGRMLASSPMYSLVRVHMAGLCQRADVLAAATSAATIGDATLELVRAMLASAGQDDLHRNIVMHEALYTRIMTYMQQHLTDPCLAPDQIARAHHISVRQLYKLWAHNEVSLGEWITAERLEGARQALTAPSSMPATIRAIAHRWGFADSTHFSRRFRGAYGMSPREWRQFHAS